MNANTALLASLERSTRERGVLRRNTLSLQRILLALVVGLVSALAIWLYLTYRHVMQRFSLLISTLKEASSVITVTSPNSTANKPQKSPYTGPSGTRIALSYAWGRLGSWVTGMPNWEFAAAVIVAFYDQQWRQTFLQYSEPSSTTTTSLSAANSVSGVSADDLRLVPWISCMFNVAREHSDYTAANILCTALQCVQGANYGCPPVAITHCAEVVMCRPQCDPQIFTPAVNSLENITYQGVSGGIGGALSGATIGAAFGPPGIILGAIFGGIFGGISASEQARLRQRAIVAKCKAASKNCNRPPSAPTCDEIFS
jgi:hypothetical protein